jgi:mono/diheme cytochrome c family protein
MAIGIFDPTASVFTLLAVLTGCGGTQSADRPAGSRDSTLAVQTPSSNPAPSAQAAGGATRGADASITPQMIALGDSIFHGQRAGGTCQTCHGAGATGTALAPNLADTQWMNGDGSYQYIVNTVTNGVPKPC